MLTRGCQPRITLGLSWLLALGWTVAADTAASAIDYPTGDSCLFCHRSEIGATWLQNAHAWTVRPVGEPPLVAAALPADATHVLGREPLRVLKQAGYGKFALLTRVNGKWGEGDFGKQCAGCHTTAVNPATLEFSAPALDCYTCHGNVPENHAEKRGTALLSRARESDAQEISSICGSCHLRGGHSLITGLPYPRSFVPGDDLFKEFQVDLERDLEGLDDHDRHVYETMRAVLDGKSEDTCVDCHRIHTTAESKESDGRRFSSICQY